MGEVRGVSILDTWQGMDELTWSYHSIPQMFLSKKKKTMKWCFNMY